LPTLQESNQVTSHEMASIIDLPSEIWQSLGSMFENVEITRLWCIGSKALNARLGCASGVRHYIMRWLPSISSSPSALLLNGSFGGVKTLEIVLGSFSSCFAIHVPVLAALPSTLTSIHFQFREAERCWRIGSYGTLGRGSHFSSPSLAHFEWSVHLPRLQSLWLEGDMSSNVAIKEPMRSDEIERLPPTLTRLLLPNNHLGEGMAVKVLPPNLTDLGFLYEVKSNHMPENFAPLLRLPLLFLHITRGSSFPNDGLDEVLHCYAPPTLTSLYMPRTVGTLNLTLPSSLTRFDCPSALLWQLPPLPACLQYLDVSSAREGAWLGAANLPRGLTYYAGPGPRAKESLSELNFALLPASLITLKFTIELWPSKAFAMGTRSLMAEPDQTQMAYISANWNECLDQLPKGLTDLSLLEGDAIDVSHLLVLPPNLTRLHLPINKRFSSQMVLGEVGRRQQCLKKLVRFSTGLFDLIALTDGHWTSLVDSIQRGDVTTCEYLTTREGMMPSLPAGGENEKALYVACSAGHLPILSYLLNRPSITHWCKRDKIGWTPMHHAVRAGHLHVLEWAMEVSSRNPKIQFDLFHTTMNRNTYTHLAARYGHIHILEWLESHSHLNLRELNSHGESPAQLAAVGDHTEVLQWLTKHA
jgi:hypothetical protein